MGIKMLDINVENLHHVLRYVLLNVAAYIFFISLVVVGMSYNFLNVHLGGSHVQIVIIQGGVSCEPYLDSAWMKAKSL